MGPVLEEQPAAIDEVIEPGKAADFAVLDAADVAHWLYHLQPNACRLTVIGGEVRWPH